MSAGSEAPAAPSARTIRTTILVAALGYFVDIYDLLLFSIVRKKSLQDILGPGVAPAALEDHGVFLINAQMVGMLLGGVLWGVLGDKKGRLSVLFGSILLYSVANLANAFVTGVNSYAALRFVAGLGLAGELGAAITLVSESMPREKRGYGTTVVASVGVSGAIFAAVVGQHFSWQTAYILGGVLGLALLVTRLTMLESGLFGRLREAAVEKGDFFSLFTSWERAGRYLACIFIGAPIWFVIGILVTFSPELSLALGASTPAEAPKAVLYAYTGLVAGDFASGMLSQLLRSRRRAVALFLTMTALAMGWYLSLRAPAPGTVYALCGLLGFGIGYWAVFVTVASEQFGTNLRATVTTSVPNFVRGSLVPLTLAWKYLKRDLALGSVKSAALVGAVTVVLAALSLARLRESYGRELDYYE
ncbi:MAG: MFS transporter [Deltaproteobacteria bacterium]|nr:MFS transporter [Deltaproteobacteria bacterium]